jgi:hypothetical protein|tara:strand:+ start:9559 stop:9810 length:252 start_codon:yes stop_codon:yes gene_type:complete
MKVKRNYKDEYKKFHSSKAAKGMRVKLNAHARKKGGPAGPGKDYSHKDGGIVPESSSVNRGRSGEGGRKKGIPHKYPAKRRNG